MNLGNVIASSYKADKKSPFVTQEDHRIVRSLKNGRGYLSKFMAEHSKAKN